MSQSLKQHLSQYMSQCSRIATCVLLLLSAPLAQATIQVDFIESAPKDRFIIKNTGRCDLRDMTLTLDLSESEGKLIFDTTASGAGVEVYQPFEVREGDIQLISAATVNDGDTSLTLSVPGLPPNNLVSFTIDVDDTLPDSALGMIRVTDAEIERSRIQIQLAGQKPVDAVFGSDSRAIAKLMAC